MSEVSVLESILDCRYEDLDIELQQSSTTDNFEYIQLYAMVIDITERQKKVDVVIEACSQDPILVIVPKTSMIVQIRKHFKKFKLHNQQKKIKVVCSQNLPTSEAFKNIINFDVYNLTYNKYSEIINLLVRGDRARFIINFTSEKHINVIKEIAQRTGVSMIEIRTERTRLKSVIVVPQTINEMRPALNEIEQAVTDTN